jgi:hypothetical protein
MDQESFPLGRRSAVCAHGSLCSGRYGSGRPIAEGLRRFDLGEYKRQAGGRLPAAGDIAEMKVGSITARLRFTETATRFGGRRLWMLCPRCSRRCRVLFIGFGRVACYAIYQKWHFAGRNLHLRLQEFLQREERRLRLADQELDESADRPGPPRAFQSPIFAYAKLGAALQKMAGILPHLRRCYGVECVAQSLKLNKQTTSYRNNLISGKVRRKITSEGSSKPISSRVRSQRVSVEEPSIRQNAICLGKRLGPSTGGPIP